MVGMHFFNRYYSILFDIFSNKQGSDTYGGLPRRSEFWNDFDNLIKFGQWCTTLGVIAMSSIHRIALTLTVTASMSRDTVLKGEKLILTITTDQLSVKALCTMDFIITRVTSRPHQINLVKIHLLSKVLNLICLVWNLVFHTLKMSTLEVFFLDPDSLSKETYKLSAVPFME